MEQKKNKCTLSNNTSRCLHVKKMCNNILCHNTRQLVYDYVLKDIRFIICLVMRHTWVELTRIDKIKHSSLKQTVDIWDNIISITLQFGISLTKKSTTMLYRELDIIYQTWERFYVFGDLFHEQYNRLIYITKEYLF